MKHMRTVVCVALMALLVGFWYVGASLGQGDEEQEGKTISLSHKLSGKIAEIVTPADVQSTRNRWEGKGGRGTVTVNGESTIIALDQRQNRIGLDIDGNGQIGAKEWSALGRSADTAFKIPLDPEDRRTDYIGVVLKDVVIFANGAFQGRIAPASCMEGKLNGKYIRLFDDNLDGQFTQDGNDAIAIGRADAAVPLLTTHVVGDRFYQLQVAADGTSVTFTPQADVVVAEVKTPIKSRALGALVLSDGQQAYDLNVTSEIPPGTYKLVYGFLKSRGMPTVMTPSAKSVTYEIRAGMVNTVQIGAPLWITFRANVSGSTFKIGHPLNVYGIGGEQYTTDFDASGNASLPVIKVTADGKDTSAGSMEYG